MFSSTAIFKNQIMETTRGPVEFIDTGEGLPVLGFHGTAAGNDLFVELEKDLIADGFRLVVPNRPGYYNTPISCGTSLADCLDRAAELLDHRQIQSTAVMGVSVGGLFATAFAARHPHRTKCLVLKCANTHPWTARRWLPDHIRWAYPLLRRPTFRKLLLRGYRLKTRIRRPRAYLKESAGRRFDDVQNDPTSLTLCRTILKSMRVCLRDPSGFENDFRILLNEPVTQARLISCPTLVIHDEQDPIAPFRHAEWAVESIPGAKLASVRTAGHLVWIGPDSAGLRASCVNFLRSSIERNGRYTSD